MIGPGAGLDSGLTGTVVKPGDVKINGRGIPTNIPGAYKPVDWDKEVAIRLDNGGLTTMQKGRIKTLHEGKSDFYILVYPEVDGGLVSWVVKHSSLDVPAGGGRIIKKGIYLDDAIQLARRLSRQATGQNTTILQYTGPDISDRSEAEEIK
jgi:hypothetical protein